MLIVKYSSSILNCLIVKLIYHLLWNRLSSKTISMHISKFLNDSYEILFCFHFQFHFKKGISSLFQHAINVRSTFPLLMTFFLQGNGLNIIQRENETFNEQCIYVNVFVCICCAERVWSNMWATRLYKVVWLANIY